MAGCTDEVRQFEARALTIIGAPASATASRQVLSLAGTEPTPTILGYYTIPTTSPTAAAAVNAATPSHNSSKTPIIIGVTIGVVVFVTLAAVLAWFFVRRWRNRNIRQATRDTTPMLRSHREEKFERDPVENDESMSIGGIFSPFGGELPTLNFYVNPLTFLRVPSGTKC